MQLNSLKTSSILQNKTNSFRMKLKTLKYQLKARAVDPVDKILDAVVVVVVSAVVWIGPSAWDGSDLIPVVSELAVATAAVNGFFSK